MSRDASDLDLAARLAIGALAGIVATMALTSAMRRLHRQLPGRTAAAPVSGPAPEIRLVLTFAHGAACGAAIAAVNPRPGRLVGALAGGGLWLAAQMDWFPSFAALPKAEKETLRGTLSSLGGHLAWGWSAAEAMRELGEVRVLLAKAA